LRGPHPRDRGREGPRRDRRLAEGRPGLPPRGAVAGRLHLVGEQPRVPRLPGVRPRPRTGDRPGAAGPAEGRHHRHADGPKVTPHPLVRTAGTRLPVRLPWCLVRVQSPGFAIPAGGLP
jgi:hypothetical protein